MSTPELRPLSAKWRSFSEQPFGRLFRLAVGRILHGDNDSEVSFSMGLLLALLPLPGGFYAVLLFEQYSTLLQWMRSAHVISPVTAAVPEEYFFIVLSMVVTGVIAVWRWNSIFPDHRDYVNLAALPLRSWTMFTANLTAILGVALVLAIDLNAASALLFPLAVGASVNSVGFFAQFVWIHSLDVVLGSVFSFFSVFLVVGILMTVLPHSAFTRFSLYIRSFMVASLVAMLTSSSAVARILQTPEPHLRFLPPVWFLGLAQSILNPEAVPYMARAGRIAVVASVFVLVSSVLIYAISYRTRSMRMAETIGNASRAAGTRTSQLFRALDRTVLRTAFQRAGYRFSIQTLFRSEQHTLILGAFMGLGLVLASQFLFSSLSYSGVAGALLSPELVAIPLILSYCIIVGLRIAFEIPTELRANWIFRLNVNQCKDEAQALALKLSLSFVLPWLWLLAVPAYAYFWGSGIALFLGVVVTVWSFLLAELLFLRFRKLPFTSPYPQFRHSAVVLAISYILGFFCFVLVTAHLEYWALFSPISALALLAIAAMAFYVFYRLRKGMANLDKEITFDEDTASGFELLDLARGS